jgi:tRNA(His) guanylyltransferase
MDLGDRMKENENITRYYLPKRCYTMIRLDGSHFHTFTQNMVKPFDDRLVKAMIATTKYLCGRIQGCKIGYVQSDEITLCLTDFDNMETISWFNGNIQKIVSTSASMASTFLYAYLLHYTDLYFQEKDIKDIPTFDSRVWTLSDKWEVFNTFLWRQQDCTRNCIQSIARSLAPHKECMNKNCSQLQDLIHEKNNNFNDYSINLKRGTFIYKEDSVIEDKAMDGNGYEISTGFYTNREWFIDNNCPILTSKNPDYIFNKIPSIN